MVLYSNYQRSNKVTASIWSTKLDLPSYFMNIILLFKNFTKGTNVKREFHNFTTRSWRHDWPHNGLKHIWSRARIDKGQISKCRSLSYNIECIFLQKDDIMLHFTRQGSSDVTGFQCLHFVYLESVARYKFGFTCKVLQGINLDLNLDLNLGLNWI